MSIHVSPPTGDRPHSGDVVRHAHCTRRGAKRLSRRHILMLALALEVLGMGLANAGRYRPPGHVVEQTLTRGHVIT